MNRTTHLEPHRLAEVVAAVVAEVVAVPVVVIASRLAATKNPLTTRADSANRLEVRADAAAAADSEEVVAAPEAVVAEPVVEEAAALVEDAVLPAEVVVADEEDFHRVVDVAAALMPASRTKTRRSPLTRRAQLQQNVRYTMI